MGQTVKIEESRMIKHQLVDLFWAMTNVVDNWQPGVDEQLEHKWIFVEVTRGKKIPHILTDDNILREMDISVLVKEIAIYIKSLDPLASQRRWSTRTYLDCANFIILSSRTTMKLDDIQKIAWRDEQVWTFARLPFNRALVAGNPMDVMREQCPVFSEFLSRFDSQKQAIAFCAWMGSLMMDRENKIHRGVILYGDGRNGKTTILNFLRKIFSHAVLYKNCSSDDKFKTDGIERSRILAFADVNNRDLFTDALIKGVIGGDSIEINVKGMRQFQARPTAKVIACTNVVPNIKDSVAETRRWVFCTVSGFAGETDEHYQDKIDSEAEWIFGCCCDIYETSRKGNDIDVDEKCMSVVTDQADFGVSFFCNQHFVKDPTAEPFPSRNISALINVTKSRVTHDRVSKYLSKHYGATSSLKRLPFSDSPVRCTFGIAMKHTSKLLCNIADDAGVD